MAVRIETQAEPIPGYKLIERLGGGGFGEVWKAEAPGGLFKAIKFVYGDLQTAGEADGCRAEQELKALSRVKSVHHPFILSLERYDIIDGQLLIVMELADRTLYDRFKECRGQGLPGIPRVELLNYMEESAEALDLMNTQYQLQHLDIKPQNLFLVYNHVKVADFGLVKDLEGMAATVTGGVTPVYAAPETFDGWVSRYSDQYSLAIVYEELLTGQRPYAGSTMRQLVLQHLQGEPDLAPLPVSDRPVVAKALSKNPDLRYPSCLEFVKALRAAGKGGAAPGAVPGAEAPPGERPTSQPPAHAEPLSVLSAPMSQEKTREARRSNWRSKRLGENGEPLPEGPPPPPDSELASLPLNDSTTTLGLRRRARAAAAATPEGSATPTAPPGGVLVPAVVVGLGYLGLKALRQFRRILNDQLGTPEMLPHIRFIYIDTDPDATQEATGGDADEALRFQEVLPARLHRPSHYLKTRDGKVPVQTWLNPKVLYRIPRQQKNAGVRALGRLAFVDNFRAISRRLEMELRACCTAETLAQVTKETGLEFRAKTPRLYVVTSLSGGTGSGMAVDLAYVGRTSLRKLGHPPDVVGVLLLPEPSGDVRAPALANTFAALTELNHFSRADAVFTARYETGENQFAVKAFQEIGPAFQRCVLASQGKVAVAPGAGPSSAAAGDALHGALARIGRYLYCDLASVLGGAAEESRRGRGAHVCRETVFQTFGLHRIFWPRHKLLFQAGQILSSRLVQHWMAKDGQRVSAEIRDWAAQQWEAHGLRLENLIANHQEQVEKQLKQPAEKMLGDVTASVAKHVTPGRNGADTLNLAPLVPLMDQLEKLIGVPEECRTQNVGTAPEASRLERTLSEIGTALAGEFEDKLAGLIVRLIEQPAYRLAGAEEAIRQFIALVEQALRAQETLSKELNDRAATMHQRIQAVLETPAPAASTQSSSFWRAPFTRKAPQPNDKLANEMVELIRAYPKARYQSLVLQQITRLYVSLRGLLSDQLREIGFCRHRLTELLDLLQPPARPGAAPASTADDKCLLPNGCSSLEEAVRNLEQGVAAPDLFNFDQQVQGLLVRQFRALVHVCMASSSVIKTLAPALVREAENFLEKRLQEPHVADMYLAQFPRDPEERQAAIVASLTDALALATPDLSKAEGSRDFTLIAVPDDTRGHALRELIAGLLPDSRRVPADEIDEILFYREVPELSLATLEHLGPGAREAYRQAAAVDPDVLHSRIDITEWRQAVTVP